MTCAGRTIWLPAIGSKELEEEKDHSTVQRDRFYTLKPTIFICREPSTSERSKEKVGNSVDPEKPEWVRAESLAESLGNYVDATRGVISDT